MLIIFLSAIAWFLIFKLDKGSNIPYLKRGGGGDDSSPPPTIDPYEEAKAQYQAQLDLYPKAQALQYQLTTDPETGTLPLTRFREDVKQQVFPEMTKTRDTLVAQALAQLVSPTGLTPEQTAAQEALRSKGISEAQRTQRTRANLGGNLFGGRAQAAEQSDIQNLVNQFTTQDIEREERNRLNSQQLAMYVWNMLQGTNVAQPTFTSPVAGADTTYSGAVQQRGQDIDYQTAQVQREAALKSAMWSAFGETAQGALTGFSNIKAAEAAA